VETLGVKKFISLPGSVKTLGVINSLSMHLQGLSRPYVGVIKSLHPTTRVPGDFRGKNILEHRVYTDFRGN
jgi:hypothetical protein